MTIFILSLRQYTTWYILTVPPQLDKKGYSFRPGLNLRCVIQLMAKNDVDFVDYRSRVRTPFFDSNGHVVMQNYSVRCIIDQPSKASGAVVEGSNPHPRDQQTRYKIVVIQRKMKLGDTLSTLAFPRHSTMNAAASAVHLTIWTSIPLSYFLKIFSSINLWCLKKGAHNLLIYCPLPVAPSRFPNLFYPPHSMSTTPNLSFQV